jgi:hypothetical protein
MDDEYKGEDRKGRVTYDKFKKAKKALKGDDTKNLLQQFMDMLQGPAKKGVSGSYPKTRRGAARKTAAASMRKKSQIPASPTR